MEGTGILTEVLINFLNVITLGYASLASEALNLIQKFLVIEIIFLGVFSFALGETAAITAAAIKKLLIIAFYIYLIKNFEVLSAIVFKSFAKAGILAGGGVISVDDLFDPSGILEMGFDQIGDFLLKELMNWENYAYTMPLFIKIILCILILVAFFIMAMMNFVLILEVYVLSACSIILVPFGLFRPTSFLAEGAISMAFRLGIKFMVFSFILCMTMNVLSDLGLSNSPSIIELIIALFTVITIIWIAGKIPNLAVNLMSGTPNLSGITGQQILMRGVSTATTAAVLGGSIVSLSKTAGAGQAASKTSGLKQAANKGE